MCIVDTLLLNYMMGNVMTKYRILEKEGTIHYAEEGGYGDGFCAGGEYYIPRFIVQELVVTRTPVMSPSHLGFTYHISTLSKYKDLKEFTSLEEAREYKKSLELKEGIVHG